MFLRHVFKRNNFLKEQLSSSMSMSMCGFFVNFSWSRSIQLWSLCAYFTRPYIWCAIQPLYFFKKDFGFGCFVPICVINFPDLQLAEKTLFFRDLFCDAPAARKGTMKFIVFRICNVILTIFDYFLPFPAISYNVLLCLMIGINSWKLVVVGRYIFREAFRLLQSFSISFLVNSLKKCYQAV